MPIKYIKLIVIVLFLTTSCNRHLQNAIHEVNKQGHQQKGDSLYTELIGRFQFVVGYKSYNASGTNLDINYYVLAFNDNRCIGYLYSFPAIISPNTKPSGIDSLVLEKNISDRVLNEISDSKSWNLNYDDSKNDVADDYCFEKTKKQCFVLHGLTYTLTILTKKKMSKSILYAPDKYEIECCSGNANRIKFLKLKKLFEEALELGKKNNS